MTKKNFKSIQTLLEKSNDSISKDKSYSQRYYFVNEVSVYCDMKMAEIFDFINDKGLEKFVETFNNEDRLKRREEKKLIAKENKESKKSSKKEPSLKKTLKVLETKMQENTLERLNSSTNDTRKFILRYMNKLYSNDCKELCNEITPSIYFKKIKEEKDLLKMANEGLKKKKVKKITKSIHKF